MRACGAGWWSRQSSWQQWGHTATLLPSGKILTLGGRDDDDLAWLLDPATMSWSAAGSSPPSGTTVSMPDGKVFVLLGAERAPRLFDPVTGSTVPLASMSEERRNAAAVRLRDGRVLVVGGEDWPYNRAAEHPAILYDPTVDGWVSTSIPLAPKFDQVLPELRERREKLRERVGRGRSHRVLLLPDVAAAGRWLFVARTEVGWWLSVFGHKVPSPLEESRMSDS